MQSNVGDYGYSWSASSDVLRSYNLGFGITQMGPTDDNYRGHGLPLRCLSE
ncbi:hypothetical protein [uncultured Rikenella sp.]|uniref:hypothetical protein n=1 Tax=uncultured Rikenella sp. TaxID=368003 RepID=UPI00260803AD|nr:hypothetical protein [uncultured Rikenella sp.]